MIDSGIPHIWTWTWEKDKNDSILKVLFLNRVIYEMMKTNNIYIIRLELKLMDKVDLNPYISTINDQLKKYTRLHNNSYICITNKATK